MDNRICTVDGCLDGPVNGRGWCNKHYRRWRFYGDPLGEPSPRTIKRCSTPDCERRAYAGGMCRPHYARVKRGELRENPTRTCDVEECDRPHDARGMCIHHYKKWRASERPCAVDDCPRKSARQGYCRGHWDRWKKHGDPLAGPPIKERAENGSPRPIHQRSGYVLIWGPEHPNAQSNGYILEHVAVMAQVLGRPLRNRENVHHLNGVRDDNRPENLELWTTMQPSGKRPRDLVRYALEILALYGDDPDATT